MHRPPALCAGLWLAGVAVFIVIAAFAAAHNTFPADIWSAHRLQDVHNEVFSRLLEYTSGLVEVPLVALVTLLFAFAFYLLAGWQPALLLFLTLIARPVNSIVKEIVDRPRPSHDLVRFDSQPSDPSFPSGHADNSVLLFGAIIYLAAMHIPNPRIRYPVQALSLWAIIGAGLERVYTGAHWPSDVLGGFLLGGLLLAGLIAVHRFVSAPRPEVTYRHPVRF